MSALRRRMLEDMRLNGLSPKTQQSYVGAVARLARHYGRSPDLLGEEDIRRFFLYLKDERHASDSTLNVYFNGIRFFFEKTLGRMPPARCAASSPASQICLYLISTSSDEFTRPTKMT